MAARVLTSIRWAITRGGYKVLQFQTTEVGATRFGETHLRYNTESEWEDVPEAKILDPLSAQTN